MKLAITHLAMALTLAVPAARAQMPAKARPQQPATSQATTVRPGRLVPIVDGTIHIGQTAPGFELDGSNGQPVRLHTLRGDWVLLAFADRVHHLAPLADVEADVRSMGIRIVGVCHEKAHSMRKYLERSPLPFLVLADPTAEVSAVYGLFDRQRTETIPGLVLMDRRSIVTLAVLGQRVPNPEVVALARVGTGTPIP